MAEAKKDQPIIIKRIKKSSGGHGGAWKIAYADFVTALMAFFLLMWLLGSTTKATLQGIANWFKNPERVSLMGGPGTGSSNSILTGGGSNLNKTVGHVQHGQSQQRIPSAQSPGTEAEEIDRQNLQRLKQELEAQIRSNPALSIFRKQLLINISPEGLRIQVVDSAKRPMFPNGSVELEPYARKIFEAIAPTLNTLPNRISITGHTDALRYLNDGRGYSNFNLSAGRANSVRQILVQHGLAEAKVLRVMGMGSAVLFDRQNPDSPLNRRVTIVVLSNAAAQRIIQNQQAVMNVSSAAAANASLTDSAATQSPTPNP
ncbi:flagellar motor protein MotB [Candidatus Igneacidithiobacillus taiwanensis]|uniref:flagellar motor protein MotB n=1 Tax=Candidatus Igneacidithiobacillus taiwanensis TaxID=1945924 RepID=UPI00289FF3E3|nr:flagellar motor protein MotB [Candidatus Igneacidithiobacillus taiwanensis]MCE5359605.1 flagellar motor protein MotB [Acidithiobacillus sp.]